MSTAPFVEIDLGALVRNYERIGAAAAPAAVAAVVKADAYGLGVGPVATALRRAGCETFFVATATEGAELRGLLGAGAGRRIFVLDGPVGDTAEFSRHGLIPVLNSVQQFEQWRNAGPAAVHVDTGMSRLGLAPAELSSLVAAGGAVTECVLLMTHLACADEPGHSLNGEQIARFEQLRRQLPGVPTSIGNSAGSLLGPETRGDLVRAGIALYGGNPFVERENPVEPVVRLCAPVIQLRRITAATTVGYGATFAAPGGALIATVAIGYADGYLRSLGNVGIAAVGGMRVPVVGRVSMDLLTLDVSAIADRVAVGDDVELFGRVVTIDEVAAAAGTISYELLTRIGRRVERRYIADAGSGTNE